jgi:cysteine synthase A
MAYYQSFVSSVGSTPRIELNRMTRELPASVALKGEFNNPLSECEG